MRSILPLVEAAGGARACRDLEKLVSLLVGNLNEVYTRALASGGGLVQPAHTEMVVKSLCSMLFPKSLKPAPSSSATAAASQGAGAAARVNVPALFSYPTRIQTVGLEFLISLFPIADDSLAETVFNSLARYLAMVGTNHPACEGVGRSLNGSDGFEEVSEEEGGGRNSSSWADVFFAFFWNALCCVCVCLFVSSCCVLHVSC